MKSTTTFLLVLVSHFLFAQAPLDPSKKKIEAFHVDKTMHIDAVLDEPEWQNAQIATDFIQQEPNPGQPSTQKSEVRVLYNNSAIYVGAYLYDAHPDSILKELSLRDNLDNTDWFGVAIDAYRDGNNGLGFIVTPRGVQLDTKWFASTNNNGNGNEGEDVNWNAVWKSAARITADGWIAEFEIPYSALRFPDTEEQTWHINFARQIRRNRETAFWNEVRPDVQGLLNQSGLIEGIHNIHPPLRLSATPFIAAYVEDQYDQNGNPQHQWGKNFNAGMDVKFGLSDAFTLDMTLIPDFGQVQSDNKVLNLSPFEVRFDENRQFFTEGTELFNKGNLFYSRRVGGVPIHYDDAENSLTANETVVRNPSTTQLYNATKISGRTNSGMGLGLFNAVSAPTYAVLRNDEGVERKIQTSPLTNYNVLSFDQNLKNNSYITLINTNVIRSGYDYDANVTGSVFEFRNKKNTYSLKGSGAISQKFYPDSSDASHNNSTVDLGHKYTLAFAKISGKIQYEAGYNEESFNYDPNDLGFLFSPNEQTAYFQGSYNIFKPFGAFNKANFSFWSQYSRLQKPSVYNSFNTGLNVFFFTKKFFAFGAFTEIEPFVVNDYFEPRTEDFSRYYASPKNYNFGCFISTDYRKRVALDVETNYRSYEHGRHRWNISVSPRFRLNDKISLIENTNLNDWVHEVGYVDADGQSLGYQSLNSGDILFGVRNQLTVENALSFKYTFNSQMGINFRARHYWTRVRYNDYKTLDTDGSLLPTAYEGVDANGKDLHSVAVNIFNIDMVYSWRFAPGSDFYIVWKNAIYSDAGNIKHNYFTNTGHLFENPQNNSLSLKVIFYLDYLQVKRNKQSSNG